MKIILPFLFLGFCCNSQTPGGGVSDIDGNQYSTIIIGTQEWMSENLRTSSYSNGEPIPNVANGTLWIDLTTGAWAHIYNDSQYENPYGKLYNWFTVADQRNICPTGWNVPSDSEWYTLTDFLGGESVAGGKMKSAGTQYWNTPNTSATNESGFSGLPGGSRFSGNFSPTGDFNEHGDDGNYWSSTESFLTRAWYRGLDWDHSGAVRSVIEKGNGFSVRCFRVASVDINELMPEIKKLIKIVDVMGKETEFKINTVLYYVYSDGTVEKLFRSE